jgi:hypothetical protein
VEAVLSIELESSKFRLFYFGKTLLKVFCWKQNKAIYPDSQWIWAVGPSICMAVHFQMGERYDGNLRGAYFIEIPVHHFTQYILQVVEAHGAHHATQK